MTFQEGLCSMELHGNDRSAPCVQSLYYPGQYTTGRGPPRFDNLGPPSVSSEVTPRSLRTLPSVRRQESGPREPTANFDINLGIINP